MFGRNYQSLRPKKNVKSKNNNLKKSSAANTLGGSGELDESVKCPKGEKLEEWFAVNFVDFYNAVNLVVGPLEPVLVQHKDVMCAGGYEYFWKDETSKKYKKPVGLKPMDFINLSFDYIEDRLNNPDIFPVEDDASYPKDYKKIVKDLAKKMYRIFAHVMVEQFAHVEKLGMSAHVSTTFKHFLVFLLAHKLLKKNELEPMHDWFGLNMSKKWCKKLKIPFKGKK